jgi:L-iditol 2-dehydrogenase
MFDGPATVDLSLIQQRERRVIGTLMYTRKDFERAMELLPRASGRLSELITHHIGLEELPETLGALSRGEIAQAVKVVVEMGAR